MDRIGRSRKVLYALGIAAMLGFGASQAFATPGEPPRALQCYRECYDQCGPDLGTKLGNGVCICCS